RLEVSPCPHTTVPWAGPSGSCSSQARSLMGRDPTGAVSVPAAHDAAVLHAGVAHRRGAGLVVLDRRVDHLADEERVGAEVEALAHLAVEPRDGLVEHRGAGGGLAYRPAVQGAVLVGGGLRELHEHAG